MDEIKEYPIWLTIHSHPIMQTGTLNLKNNVQVDLHEFLTDSFSSYIPLIKILDISGNFSIESLEGLPYLPHIHVFNANATGLLTFKNFKSISHATKVSFKDTPISKYITYRLAILLIFGKKLISIDGSIISNNLYQKYEQYPKYASELVNRGWIVEFPCPNENRLAFLCDLYNLERPAELDNILAIDKPDDDISESSISQSNSTFNFIDSFQNIVNEYHSRQKQMFKDAEVFFAPSVTKKKNPRNVGRELAISIKNLFFEHGRLINENDVQGTLRAVDELCQKALLKKKISESLTKQNYFL